jgi:sec-independent protein translocase protein TatA
MGISGISWGEILIILLVVILIFGTGKLSRIGGDLGNAIRGFRAAMKDDTPEAPPKDTTADTTHRAVPDDTGTDSAGHGSSPSSKVPQP